jgi:hypothetical protein
MTSNCLQVCSHPLPFDAPAWRVPSLAIIFRDLQNTCEKQYSKTLTLTCLKELGCDFCRLILECFKGTPKYTPYPGSWPDDWLGSQCKIEDSMYAMAKKRPNSNVRLSINSDNVSSGDTIEQVSVLNTILVKVGPDEILYDDGEDDEEFLSYPPQLVLRIQNHGHSMQLSVKLKTFLICIITIDMFRCSNREVTNRMLSDRP